METTDFMKDLSWKFIFLSIHKITDLADQDMDLYQADLERMY